METAEGGEEGLAGVRRVGLTDRCEAEHQVLRLLCDRHKVNNYFYIGQNFYWHL